MTEAYDKACAAWVEEVSQDNRPFTAERPLMGKRKPEPAAHVDQRMHLTLDDMPKVEPTWPSATKQHLTGYRHTVQKDSDPDTQQRPMYATEADLILVPPTPDQQAYLDSLSGSGGFVTFL